MLVILMPHWREQPMLSVHFTLCVGSSSLFSVRALPSTVDCFSSNVLLLCCEKKKISLFTSSLREIILSFWISWICDSTSHLAVLSTRKYNDWTLCVCDYPEICEIFLCLSKACKTDHHVRHVKQSENNFLCAFVYKMLHTIRKS